MTDATTTTTIESGKAILEMARRSTMRMISDIPPDKCCHQPVANGNPAIWVLGHLTATDNFFLTTLGGRPAVIDESWNRIFGMGSEPSGNPADYPSFDQVRTASERARDALIDWFDSLDEQQLNASLPDDLKGFAPNVAGVMTSIAWHEGLHCGQLSAVRRSLGLPRALEP